MKLVVVFLLLVVVNVESADRNRLKTRPRGIDNFDIRKFMGKWYLYAISSPCSWQGSAQFKEWISTYYLDSNTQIVTIGEVWKKDGTCTYTTAKATMTSAANFKVVDQIGDLWSGRKIIMCTDYNNYVIAWGCVKESVHKGMCDDYWYSVNTRNPKPSRQYVDEINKRLYQYWGTSLSEMVMLPHSHPCDQPVQRSARMYKTY